MHVTNQKKKISLSELHNLTIGNYDEIKEIKYVYIQLYE